VTPPTISFHPLSRRTAWPPPRQFVKRGGKLLKTNGTVVRIRAKRGKEAAKDLKKRDLMRNWEARK
jgi:hypothetical protein